MDPARARRIVLIIGLINLIGGPLVFAVVPSLPIRVLAVLGCFFSVPMLLQLREQSAAEDGGSGGSAS